MPDEREFQNRPGVNVLDVISKLWPIAVVIAAFFLTSGRRDEKTDLLIQQNGELQRMVSGLTDDIRKLSERVARLEATQQANDAARIQEQAYRNQVSK